MIPPTGTNEPDTPLNDAYHEHTDEDQELLQAVAKYGTRWNIVRRDIESWKSPDAVRKRYERIFKK